MSDESLQHARLDRALRQAIVAPALPAGFRQRLTAAIARNSSEDAALRRGLLERERLDQLAELHRDSVRLRLKTLGSLIGGAFTAGVGTTLAWPWINATFAPHAGIALLVISAGLGLAIGVPSWLHRTGAAPWTR
jgi:hypothetical protein